MIHISSYIIDIKHLSTGHWGECLEKTAWNGVSWLVHYTIQYWEEQRMRWAWHVARMGKTRYAVRCGQKTQWWGDREEELVTAGSIILKWTWQNQDGKVWTEFMWQRIQNQRQASVNMVKKKPGWVQSGHFGQEKNLLLLPGFKIRIFQLAAQSPHQLHYHGLMIKLTWTETKEYKMYGRRKLRITEIRSRIAWWRGYILRNASRRFSHCANVIECTYTNLESIAYYTPRLYGTAYCS